MRIWVTEIGEPLPLETEARLLRYGLITREWARLGHDVTWWASNFSHAKRRFVSDGDKDVTIDGVHLKLLKGPGYGRSVSPGRFAHHRSFAKRFAAAAAAQTPPDVIITTVPTLETAAEAVKLGQAWGVPVLVDIRDEWPEEFVDLAPVPLRPVARLVLSGLFRQFGEICRGATGVIAPAEEHVAYGLRYAGRERREADGVFPHPYFFHVSKEEREAARKQWHSLGVRPDVPVFCFVGTIGRFFELGTVIEAAKVLSITHPCQFVLCGDGSGLEGYRREAAGVPEVIFPGWVGAAQVASLMDMSTAALAPYRKGWRARLPNKAIEYLAGGLPVISTIPGEYAALLETHDCGATYEADDSQGLVRALLPLCESPERARQMGERAGQLFGGRFSLEIVAANLLHHLEGVVRNFSSPHSRGHRSLSSSASPTTRISPTP